jgi:GTPase Era involved in 16S rRNA processing
VSQSLLSQVTKEQAKKVAAQLKLDYFEISAKTGDNVEQLFESILDSLNSGRCHFPYDPKPIEQIKEEDSSNHTGFNLGIPPPPQEKTA